MNEPTMINEPPAVSKPEQSSSGILDEFQTELVTCWPQLPNKAFFFGLLAAWLALFQFLGNSVFGYIATPSLYVWMVTAYNGNREVTDDVIGNFIPFLVLGLFWWKRKQLLALPLRVWSPALALVAFGVALHVFGYVAQQPRISIVAWFVGIYGLMGLAWGWRVLRAGFFPFFLFIFSMPLGNQAEIITVRLQLLVTWLVEKISHGLGIGVVRAGNLLFDPSGSYQYEVAAPCSGIRSLIVIFLLATAYGFIVFRSPWKRMAMMAMAPVLAVLGNLVRMLLIVMAASFGGQSWGNYVHDGGPGGIISLLPYILAMIILFTAGGWLEKKFVEAKPKP